MSFVTLERTHTPAHTHPFTLGQDQFRVVSTGLVGVRAGFITHFSKKRHSIFMWP